MNAGRKIKLSLLIVILASSALISDLTPAQAPNETQTSYAGQMKIAPATDHAVDPAVDSDVDKDGDKDADEVVNETPTSLLELVEFYSRKYFKFALDYLFEFLNSLGIFAPDDLASNLNYVDRSAAQFT